MAKVAFELRADVKEFAGGSVSLPGGASFDVGTALTEGDGKIVLDPIPSDPEDEKERERAARDEQIVSALGSYSALKNVSAGDDEPISEETAKSATSSTRKGR